MCNFVSLTQLLRRRLRNAVVCWVACVSVFTHTSINAYVCVSTNAQSRTHLHTSKIYHKNLKHKLHSTFTTHTIYIIIQLTFNFYNIVASSQHLNLIYIQNSARAYINLDLILRLQSLLFLDPSPCASPEIMLDERPKSKWYLIFSRSNINELGHSLFFSIVK